MQTHTLTSAWGGGAGTRSLGSWAGPQTLGHRKGTPARPLPFPHLGVCGRYGGGGLSECIRAPSECHQRDPLGQGLPVPTEPAGPGRGSSSSQPRSKCRIQGKSLDKGMAPTWALPQSGPELSVGVGIYSGGWAMVGGKRGHA